MIIHYKGKPLKQTYKPDLICYNKIIVEIKAVKAIAPEPPSPNPQLLESHRNGIRTLGKLRKSLKSNYQKIYFMNQSQVLLVNFSVFCGRKVNAQYEQLF